MSWPSQSEAPATTPSSADPRQSRRLVAATLAVSGVATIAVAIALGIAIDPLLYLVALIGLIDLALARMFATGRLGGGSSDAADAAAIADADPSYNPYARED